MTKLGDLYTDFSRIDLDARGGYARVADVIAQQNGGYPVHRAFKLMRHKLDYQKGMERFEDELRILAAIAYDNDAPSTITRIYDSGFAPVELSQRLHEREMPNPELEIVSTGTDPQKFCEIKSEKEPNQWLPYLVVELASYDDSLFRQVRNQSTDNQSGLFRLPTGEVIFMAFQLLEVMNYLHVIHHRAYMDWKPEHIFWDGFNRAARLIDWNVTVSLDDTSGVKQNIRDDLRLFCGAALYIPLAFVDPDDPTKPIGSRPTKDITAAIPEIRHRYLTDNPDFYQRGTMLDNEIKQIIKRGLDPKQGFDSVDELKMVLKDYAVQELGLQETDFTLLSELGNPYLKAISEMRMAQHQLIEAQQHLVEAVKTKGKRLEYTRLFDEIKHALKNFPGS